jgi:hypothetical protein
VIGAGGPGRGWLRAAGLFGVTLALAPVGPMVLLTVPLVLLGGALGGWRGLVVAVPALLVAWGSGPQPGLWYLERGWALLAGGWFLGLTLRWPGTAVTARGVGAVTAAAATAGLVLSGSAEGWTVVEWAVRARLEQGAGSSMELMRLLSPEGEAVPALEQSLTGLVEAQLYVLPALLGLATIAALALSWWIVVRATTGRSDGVVPVATFRFADGLVWVLIGGILLVLGGGDQWTRVGANAVVFMVALYALRGVGVVLGVRGGLSPLGWVLVGLGLVFAAPALLTGAFLVGLGDTWLDLRARADGPAG